ncbi:hypothetical protein SAMD00079811_76580 (plasmid) [Scytonema sp. HK-05]|uniref:hypothetical protein n=1 Tax=Scytonema sp. HK-05 TaxID=1137095 RepID=UPI0009366EC7|nr:hypothetical protein [Scytonema sp. HK-05]OKH53621.1 hypothetical protein NIES2130_30190 [Scytonema sp. HK-05]BAY50029.1 hypothetical protein SAMD00079811_76580 [Scytonema sp. HK-05]
MRNDFLIDTQSAGFVADEVVVKAGKRNWVYQPTVAETGDRFAPKKIDADSVAKTRKLLDGAVAYAWKTVKSKRKPPALTRTRWVWRLAGSYHLCHPTKALMEEALSRFAATGRESLAQWAAEKATEEAGHDRLALLDIQSMGYDAEAVVKALFPPAAKTLVDYFTQSVYATDPIGCVGYCYTSERLAICRGEDYIQKVKAQLPPDTADATRCLRVHSGVGADMKHVEETIAMVAGLALQERTRVAAACYETALLCFSPPKENYISEEELEYVLKPLEHTKNHN